MLDAFTLKINFVDIRTNVFIEYAVLSVQNFDIMRKILLRCFPPRMKLNSPYRCCSWLILYFSLFSIWVSDGYTVTCSLCYDLFSFFFVSSNYLSQISFFITCGYSVVIYHEWYKLDYLVQYMLCPVVGFKYFVNGFFTKNMSNLLVNKIINYNYFPNKMSK